MGEEQEPEPVRCCDLCEVESHDPLDAMRWSLERERGVERWLCVNCARSHVRDLEGRLDPAYWSAS